MARILCIEDDETTAREIISELSAGGFEVEWAADGREGLVRAVSEPFAAITLDRMLPSVDGLAIVSVVRQAGLDIPILMVSALSDVDERVKGLRAGGDDYLTKPFGFSELSARLENLMRRGGAKGAPTNLACADLHMDLLSRKVTRAGRTLDLLPREFKLLEHLLRNKDRVVTRTMLLEQVWDYRFDPHTSLIDTHVSRLRKKIDEGFDRPLLHTLRGTGYRLSEQR
jgi:two-component system OmpR family response regulator